MKLDRNTKILATLGPSSSTPGMIEKLFLAGANVFRLNFSHGTHEGHQQRFDAIRQIEAKYHRPIGILADLQGPKLRVGTFKNGSVALQPGQEFTFYLKEVEGDEKGVTLPHPEIFRAVTAGEFLYLNDGNVRAQIISAESGKLVTQIVAGDMLSDRKGVNVPDAVLGLSALTEKDRIDLEYALETGVDWIALSFVQKPEDLVEAHELIKGRARLMAKLEKPSAINHLDEIIGQADGLMVARGDLGVEMPPETVPGIQKEILLKSRQAGKPAVVATQMLESMVSSPVPTRAEASDVATAVFEGADAVMLSAESAAGDFPVESVAMMQRIIQTTEQGRFYRAGIEAANRQAMTGRMDAISNAAASVVETVGAKVIVTHTRTGNTAYRASRERPPVPIICVTQSEEASRALSIAWGVHAVHTGFIPGIEEAVRIAGNVALRHGFAAPGDTYVMTAGVPFGRAGSTNTLRIVQLPDEAD